MAHKTGNATDHFRLVLKRLCRANNLTVDDVIHQIEVDADQIEAIKTGPAPLLFPTVCKIADLFGVSTDHFRRNELNLTERIHAVIEAYPDWSPAERRKMDMLKAEIMEHVKNGTGNGFIRDWCNRFLVPKFKAEGFVVR